MLGSAGSWTPTGRRRPHTGSVPPTALVMSWLVIGDSHSPGCRSIGAISSALQARSAAALAAEVGLRAAAVAAGQARSGLRITRLCGSRGAAARQRAAWATSNGSRVARRCRRMAPRIQQGSIVLTIAAQAQGCRLGLPHLGQLGGGLQPAVSSARSLFFRWRPKRVEALASSWPPAARPVAKSGLGAAKSRRHRAC